MKSKAGWALATLYLVASAICLHEAVYCRDDFFCAIRSFPMLIPAGVVYLMLYGDRLANPAILQWQLLVPTFATNALIYYLLGRLPGRIWQSQR